MRKVVTTIIFLLRFNWIRILTEAEIIEGIEVRCSVDAQRLALHATACSLHEISPVFHIVPGRALNAVLR